MDLEGKNYKVCSICQQYCNTCIRCTNCNREFHDKCFYSQAHYCKTCKYCEIDECVARLKKRVSSINAHKMYANCKQIKEREKRQRNAASKNLIKKIEKKVGKFDVIKYHVTNKGCISEFVTLYSKQFAIVYTLDYLFWTNLCKICCCNFHTINKDVDICKECQVCWNCNVTKEEMVQQKLQKEKESDAQLDSASTAAQSTGTGVNANLQFLLAVPKDSDKQQFVAYKTKSSENAFADKYYAYCKPCYDKYAIKNELCPICMKQYTQEDMIECDYCIRWIHYSCVKDNKTKKVLAETNAEQEMYHCDVCIALENAWLGRTKKMPVKIEQTKKQLAIEIHTKDKPDCCLCTKKYNDIEALVNEMQVLQDTNLQMYAHKACLYSWYKQKNDRLYATKTARKCQKCKKPGAHLRCIFCRQACYHFDCAFDNGRDLFRSNVTFPICQLHYSNNIEHIVAIAKNLDKLVFYTDDANTSNVTVLDAMFIDKNGRFTAFVDKDKKYKLYFDQKNIYLNNKMTTHTEFDDMCQQKNINRCLAQIIAEYNSKMQKLGMQSTLCQRYNKCLNTNVQQSNYTLSYISYLVSTNKDLEIKRSSIHGKGVFAKRVYMPNEVIIDYRGNYIDISESDIYENAYNGADFYMFKTSGEVVDATIVGNIAKFINQSCDPNCYSTEATFGSRRCILICAQQYIFAGEELTYKYRMNGNKLLCNCNSIRCKKTLN